jgi:hypothetical protein
VVLSKGYTKAYGFRGDGSITYQNVILQGDNCGTDTATVTQQLYAGVYMLVTNFHPYNPERGLYFISIASSPSFNKIVTIIADSTVQLSIDNNNVLTIITSSYERGLLIRLRNKILV